MVVFILGDAMKRRIKLQAIAFVFIVCTSQHAQRASASDVYAAQGDKAMRSAYSLEIADKNVGGKSKRLSENDMQFMMMDCIGRGKAAVKARLRDPGSVEWGALSFSWGINAVPLVCGEVNSKNGFGGYTGMQRFISAGTPELTFLQSEVEDFPISWGELCGKKYNSVAVKKWGPEADKAPIRFR